MKLKRLWGGLEVQPQQTYFLPQANIYVVEGPKKLLTLLVGPSANYRASRYSASVLWSGERSGSNGKGMRYYVAAHADSPQWYISTSDTNLRHTGESHILKLAACQDCSRAAFHYIF